MHNDKRGSYVYVKNRMMFLCDMHNDEKVKKNLELAYRLKTHLKPVLDVLCLFDIQIWHTDEKRRYANFCSLCTIR